MRELMPIDKKKLKKEDLRFLLNINHTELLFNENMLLQNRTLIIVIFALFIALLSLIINLDSISNLFKSVFITLLSISSLYLLILFFKSIKSVKEQNSKIKKSYEYLFYYNFNYAKDKQNKGGLTK